jgi:hypothetical protein
MGATAEAPVGAHEEIAEEAEVGVLTFRFDLLKLSRPTGQIREPRGWIRQDLVQNIDSGPVQTSQMVRADFAEDLEETVEKRELVSVGWVIPI